MTSCPASLKVLLPYEKLAKEFEKRDPIVSYYATMYAVQRGIKMPESKEKSAKSYLMSIMDGLEKLKQALGSDSEYLQEVVGQAHIEEVGVKLFSWADDQDRNSNFSKPVIKAFYTASNIFEILRQFGDLSVEVEEKKKYAQVKTVYLSACLKSGEIPVPGNPERDTEPIEESGPATPLNTTTNTNSNTTTDTTTSAAITEQIRTPSGLPISSDLLQSAESYCKYAASSLQYQDVACAISYLQKSLNILTNAKDL